MNRFLIRLIISFLMALSFSGCAMEAPKKIKLETVRRDNNGSYIYTPRIWVSKPPYPNSYNLYNERIKGVQRLNAPCYGDETLNCKLKNVFIRLDNINRRLENIDKSIGGCCGR